MDQKVTIAPPASSRKVTPTAQARAVLPDEVDRKLSHGDATGRDFFVHISAVSLAGIRELNAGDRVEFTLETDARSGRPCAANLRLI
jgi:cold shock CspA family protein